MHVLVLNAGSSSLRFQVIETDSELALRDADRRLASGIIERVGSLALIRADSLAGERTRLEAPLPDHRAAIEWMLRWLVSSASGVEPIGSLADVHAVGHRVVHGGQRFRESVRIDAEVLAGIEDCIELAPLHNPANLKGIRAVQELLGQELPQVAVFDTAFHATMPETSYLYAIPYHYFRRFQVRRYGFHGTSHRYVSRRYARLLGLERAQVNVISLHLGNGCSACAIRGGLSFDSSMGFTPLEGLVMGTRSGDVDPAVLEFLAAKEGGTLEELVGVLNKQSGLLGLSGLTSDMRELLAEEEQTGDRRARLAIEVFCQRARKYIGAFFAEMGGADALLFTGGIGENSALIRARICAGLECLGLELSAERNAALCGGESGEISRPGSRLRAFVIQGDEELMVARETARVLGGKRAAPDRVGAPPTPD